MTSFTKTKKKTLKCYVDAEGGGEGGVEKAERFETEPDENTSAAERHVNYSSNKTLGEVEY